MRLGKALAVGVVESLRDEDVPHEEHAAGYEEPAVAAGGEADTTAPVPEAADPQATATPSR